MQIAERNDHQRKALSNYIWRMFNETLTPEIPEKKAIYSSGMVEMLLVGRVTVRSYSVTYC
jgi:hypothetical protein